jgi:hypothetical protein
VNTTHVSADLAKSVFHGCVFNESALADDFWHVVEDLLHYSVARAAARPESVPAGCYPKRRPPVATPLG